MGLSTAVMVPLEDGVGALVGVICASRTVNQLMITILEGVAIAGKAGMNILTAREAALSIVPLMTDLWFAGLLYVSRSPL